MTEKTTAKADIKQLKSVIEAALMASEVPLSVRKIRNMFEESVRPETSLVNKALKAIEKDCANRGIELRQIGKGYRFQTKDEYAGWLRKLRDTRPPRYSRALVETLSIVAYRQPVTRGDIEGIRGVAVSSDIMRTLLDREWINQVGHRDVPGRPALYATTDGFLEYFNLRSLSDLPALMEPRDVTDVAKDLNITLPMTQPDLSQGVDVVGDGEDDEADGEYDEETDVLNTDVIDKSDNEDDDEDDDDEVGDQDTDPDPDEEDSSANNVVKIGSTRNSVGDSAGSANLQTEPAASTLKVVGDDNTKTPLNVEFSDLDELPGEDEDEDDLDDGQGGPVIDTSIQVIRTRQHDPEDVESTDAQRSEIDDAGTDAGDEEQDS